MVKLDNVVEPLLSASDELWTSLFSANSGNATVLMYFITTKHQVENLFQLQPTLPPAPPQAFKNTGKYTTLLVHN